MKLDFPTILGLVTVSILCIFAVSIGVFGHDILSIEEPYYTGERWIVEYGSALNSFPIEQVEKMFYGTTDVYGVKFKIVNIESVLDYKNNMHPYLQERFFKNMKITDNMFILTISGSWSNEHIQITNAFEEIDGVTNAVFFSGFSA